MYAAPSQRPPARAKTICRGGYLQRRHTSRELEFGPRRGIGNTTTARPIRTDRVTSNSARGRQAAQHSLNYRNTEGTRSIRRTYGAAPSFNGTGGDDTETGRLRTLLRQNREVIARAEQARDTLETELTQPGRLEEQVSHYEETDVPGKLAVQQRLSSDAAVFDERTRRIGGVEQRLQRLTRSVGVRDLAATFTDADSSPQKEHLDRATAAVKQAKDDIDQLLADA